MTFSIVARDTATGELGVAVQTRYFSVGSVTPWAEPGVGAVATQAFAEVWYGPNGLAAMREGLSAQEALERCVRGDDSSARRQVAMVDASGRPAAFTGSDCIPACGHVTRDGVSVQANMMERETVWPAMLAAYSAAEGDLAERLLAALRAGDAEGGDMRGRQSAALLVTPGGDGRDPWERRFDLRVDDHREPIGELARLLRVARAYEHGNRGLDLLSEGRLPESLAEHDRAAELAPEDDQLAFWRAGALAANARFEDARDEYDRIRAIEPRWPAYLRRLAVAGMLPNDPAFLDAIAPLDPPQDLPGG